MEKAFLSPSWYRVSGLTPRLRSQAEIHRQRFRGQTWYILQDHQSGKFFRVSPAANLIVCLMDGRRTVDDLWLFACERFPEDPPTQDETIRLLSQLHQADLMHADLAPDLDEVGRRAEKQARRAMLQRIRNPLALRFPLLDPERFLDATFPLVRWLFSPLGLLAWLAVVATGATLAAMNFGPLTSNLVDRVLATQNLLLLALTYPVIKAIHELGHGYAVKAAGGEVHEMGIMFLVLMPIPYVDASAASAFASKWRRILVDGAGIMVELALAALAMIFWINAEPGLARAIAFNVMLIGGVSTLLFNGNPLLRFDGYYVFADAVEIPNLGQRANRYVFYLAQKLLFGRRDAESPVTAPGERGWFVSYAIASFVYRVGIAVSIALFIAGKFFFIGVLLAIWALASMFLLPLVKGIWFVLSSAALRGRRARAVTASGVVAALPAAALLAVPLPYATLAEGVVLAPQSAVLRTDTEGFLAAAPQAHAARVAAGDSLLRLEDPLIETRVRLLDTQLAEFRQRLAAAGVLDRVEAQALRAQVRHLEESLALERARMAALTLRAPRDGAFVTAVDASHLGRFVPKGQEVGYVLQPGELVLRAVVPQTRVDLVRQRADDVRVRFASDSDTIRPATVLREVTESRELPAPALASQGGGTLAVDPTDPEGRRLLQPAFQLDLAPLALPEVPRIGERVWVRFDHGDEPLAPRLYRSLRQLFLSRFNV